MADIELVIKIPESQYKTLHAKTQADVIDVIDDKLLIDAIKNGVPLPKGHGRLIDADEIQFERTEFETYGDYCIAFDAIDQADTIIETDAETGNEDGEVDTLVKGDQSLPV